MKKTAKTIAALLCLLLVLAGCTPAPEYTAQEQLTLKEAQRLNEGSSLGTHGLLSPPSDDTAPPEGMNAAHFSRFPETNGALSLTAFSLTSDALHVYGVQVGMSTAEAADILALHGYTVETAQNYLTGTKDGVAIRLYFNTPSAGIDRIEASIDGANLSVSEV